MSHACDGRAFPQVARVTCANTLQYFTLHITLTTTFAFQFNLSPIHFHPPKTQQPTQPTFLQ
jgi:hypothetical protein